jgi:hypothetical protein
MAVQWSGTRSRHTATPRHATPHKHPPTRTRAPAARTWPRVLAELVHVLAARLCQDDVVAVVRHLHALVVEHFLLALAGRDVVLLVLWWAGVQGGGAGVSGR